MKCRNCNHPIVRQGKGYSHQGNTAGDMCFVDGCECVDPVGAKGERRSKTEEERKDSHNLGKTNPSPANPTGNLEWLYMKNALRQTFRKINKGNNRKMLENLKGDGK